MLAHLNLGSNMGDRLGNITRAVALIETHAGHVTATSTPVESEPWGFESTARFLNVGINIETQLQPLELLDTLQRIERMVSAIPHRNPDGTYRDRPIDIDIIDCLIEQLEPEQRPQLEPEQSSQLEPEPSSQLEPEPSMQLADAVEHEHIMQLEPEQSSQLEHESEQSRYLAPTPPRYSRIEMRTERLTLPHANMHLRQFVLAPYREIFPTKKR